MPTIINQGLPSEFVYETRAERRQARAETLREAHIARDLRARHRTIGERVDAIKNSTGMEIWPCGDGRAVFVNDMNDSHLFYAIAKAYRNEYPDSRARKTGVEALKREALRRLLRAI